MKRTEQLRRIQKHINEWESLDKESLLMEILNDHLSSEELNQLMLDQDIPLVDGIESLEQVVSVHVGYDDHVSGFNLTLPQLRAITDMVVPDNINDYIIKNGVRVEVNEADLFFDTTSGGTYSRKMFKDAVYNIIDEGTI